MPEPLTYTRHNDAWYFSDGSVLPVVSGGDGSDPPAPTPASETPPAPPAPPTPPPVPEADPYEGGATSFDRAYVEKLRKENAGYRTRAKSYEDAFGDLADPDREAVLGFVTAYRRDPTEAGKIAGEWAKALTPEERGAAAEGAGAAPDDAPMTRAEFTAAMAQLEEKRSVEAATAEIQTEARALGYDPEGLEYPLLLKLANEQTGGDMKKAHEALLAWKQGFVNDYVEGKKRDANGAPVVPQVGSPAAGDKPPPTEWGEIHKAAKEFLANIE